MHVVDANVLLYAVDESSTHHAAASAWLDEALAGHETVALCWIVIVAFLRISTQAALFGRPLPAEEAVDTVVGWLGR